MNSKTVPSGWRTVELGDLAMVNAEAMPNSTPPDSEIEYLDITSIPSTGRLNGTTTIVWAEAPSRARRIVRSGDIVVSTVRPYLRAFARIHHASPNLVASTGFAVIRARDGVDAEFLYQSVLSAPFMDHLLPRMIGSNYPAVSAADVAALPLQLPPLLEQRKIAEILSSIDDAIERTEGVIARVGDVKRALAQQLLTRGMPGRHSRYKRTEVGEIPKEWKVVRLRDVAHTQSGIAKNAKAARSSPVTLPYLRVANVQDGFIDLSEIKSITVDATDVPRCSLQAGDVLFTEGGDPDKLGRGAVWTAPISPCLHQNHVFAVRPARDRLLPEYLAVYAASSAGKRYFLKASKQTTNLASVNATQLGQLPVALPSVDDQKAIICALSAVDQRLGGERARRLALATCKSDLASALLTGQLRVSTELQPTEVNA